MAENNKGARIRYLAELGLQLRKQGFGVQPADDMGMITVEWMGQPLCEVNGAGNTRYRSEDMRLPEIEEAKDKVIGLANTTAEYMKLMESAPRLKAGGLGGDYRILADFNDTVLAGHATQYGVEFVTWNWNFDHTGVCYGNYFDFGAFDAAKQDFAVRSGLVAEKALFTPEQLTDLYGAISFQRDHDESLGFAGDQRLDKIQGQIDVLIPDVVERLEQQQPPAGPEMGGLT